MRRSSEWSIERPVREIFGTKQMMAIVAFGAVGAAVMNPAAAQADSLEQLYAPNGTTVVAGGTNDRYAQSMPLLGGDMASAYANSQTIIYDAQAGPMVGTVPYDVSVGGVERDVSTVLSSGGEHTAIGFSQGSDGVVRGAVDARRQGLLDEDKTKLILIGNPSNPGAPGSNVRGIAYSLPSLPGFESVKPHADLGATQQTEICLQYDPTCRFDGNDPVNMALGYIAHTGQGPFTNYNTVDPASAIVQHDGAVTHVTYMTPTPVQELQTSMTPEVPVVTAAAPYEVNANVYEEPKAVVPLVDSIAVHDTIAAAIETAPQLAPQITQVGNQVDRRLRS
ncbi:MAG: hypothetical protein EOO17_06250 [Chloroflexi bacterium]|nr:MAG: hypothetical protein EOO17_06250 [Chloroflexota bacterium]